MIIVIGSIVTNDQNREEILAQSIAHCRRSRTEPGCISHQVHQDCESDGHLVFVEKWADRESLLKHFAVPESGAFLRDVSALADEKPELEIYGAEEIDPANLVPQ